MSIFSDIAIIGIDGRFPQAKSVTEFWQNLSMGKEGVTFFTDEELFNAGVLENLIKNPQYVKASPILKDVDLFDAEFFKFSPYEADILDPQQRLFLECSWKALEDAGYPPSNYEGSVGVFAGSGGSISGYLLEYFKGHPEIQGTTGSVEHLGNDKDFLPTRVSYKLNLKGPSVDVQTACSTGAVAVHLACKSLIDGECDIALAGSVNIRIPQICGYLRREGDVFSGDGHCRPFDSKASGMVFGSGLGIVVLKPLQSALRDRDHIYAVIKGSAVNNDGGNKLSFAAASKEGQMACMQKAFDHAGVSPETISFVEAHGTGTAMGDPVEVSALSQVFRKFTDKKEFCSLGSVKANIGHLDIASGIVSLIKAALMLHYKKIPPQINIDKPNPKIELHNSPFYITKNLEEWNTDRYPRRACVNSLGMGGTNSFLILEEAPLQVNSGDIPERPHHLFTLSARTSQDLDAIIEDFKQFLKKNPDHEIANIAYTANTGRSLFNNRLILIADTKEQLLRKLENGEFNKVVISKPPTIAFLFQDEDHFYANMGRQLYSTHPIFKQYVDEGAALLKISAETVFDNSHPKGHIIIECALAELWKSWGLQPKFYIGKGSGSIAAAIASGKLALADGLARSSFQEEEVVNEDCVFLVMGEAESSAIEGKKILSSLCKNKEDWTSMLDALKQLYLQGFVINWRQFDAPYQRSKVSLPTYPFQGKSHWLKKGHPTKINLSKQHPLLLHKLQTPLLEDATIFSTEINKNWPDFVEDHVIYDTSIVPGATYISTILSAAKLLKNQRQFSLTNIEFHRPLIVPFGVTRKVQTIIFPVENGKRRFEIYSSIDSVSKWMKHASGILNEDNNAVFSINSDSIEQIKSRCPYECPKDKFFTFAKDIGLSLGPSLRWLENIYIGEQEVLGRLRPPQNDDEEGYVMHPGLLDSCLQIILGKKIVQEEYSTLTIPFDIEKFLYTENLGRPYWIHLKYLRTNQENSVLVDLTFFNEAGQPIGQVKNLMERSFTQEMYLNTLNEMTDEMPGLYEIEWKEKPLPQQKSGLLKETWIVFFDSFGLGEKLSEMVKAQSCDVVKIYYGNSFAKLDEDSYRINPEIQSDFKHLLAILSKNHSIKGILYLSSLENENEQVNSEALMKSQRNGVQSVFYLLQALIEAKLQNELFLCVVTNGIQDIENCKILPHQSTLEGLIKSALLEYPEMQSKQVDLEARLDPGLQSQHILQELLYTDSEEQVAYRQGIRYVDRLKHHKENSTKQVFNLNASASYLITGGMGGLGLKAAECLSSLGAKHLVLASRHKPKPQTLKTISELEQKGITVEIVAVDVANEEDVSSLINKFGKSWPDLKGIIHAAGNIDDALLLSQDWEKFQKVFSSKIKGTLNLHHTTLHKTLDFFVLFSSIASVLGSAGQSNYAAANSFLDGFARFRRKLGLPALTINWGPWSDVGIAAQLTDIIKMKGWRSISPEQGIKALELALQTRKSHLLITNIDWNTYVKNLSRHLSLFSDLISISSPKPEASNLATTLQKASPASRKSIVKDHLRRLVMKQLNLPTNHPPKEEQSFFDLGMDSLIAVDMRNKLQEDIGSKATLAASLLFNYSNIDTLSDYIIDLLFSEKTAKDSDDTTEPEEKDLTYEDFKRLLGE